MSEFNGVNAKQIYELIFINIPESIYKNSQNADSSKKSGQDSNETTAQDEVKDADFEVVDDDK